MAPRSEGGAAEVADEQGGLRAGADDPAEKDGRSDAAGQGSEGVEDRDRESANFEREDFAYG